jgi:Ceramidase
MPYIRQNFTNRCVNVAGVAKKVHLPSISFAFCTSWASIMNITSTRNVTALQTSVSALRHGYWGIPTATIDWCEPNYQHSFYIAEFWNTVSNILFVLLGLFGLYRSMQSGFEARFHACFIAVLVTGLGSAMFHGTLQLV